MELLMIRLTISFNPKKLQRCSKCERWVEKNTGCNHMTCICSHEFCYVCGADYPCQTNHPYREDEDDDESDYDDDY